MTMTESITVKREDRNNVVDLIRGIAILLVFFVHYGQIFGNPDITRFGQMGCQMFFVISGYTCSFSLKKSSTYKDFYIKRAKSLLPGYYTMLLFVVMGDIICFCMFHKYMICNNIEPVSIICNFLLLNSILPFCQNNVFPGGWFIGAIVFCYVLHPFVDKLFQRVKRKYIFVVIMLLLLSFITVIINIALENTYVISNNSFEYFLFTNQFGCYLIGIYLFYSTKNDNRNCKYDLLISILLIFVAIILFYYPISLSFLLCPIIVGLFTYYLFKFFNNIKMEGNLNKLICKVGINSFAIYLTHWFVVWRVTTALRKLLLMCGINSEMILFIVILIPAFITTYILVLVLNGFLKFINNGLTHIFIHNRNL